MQITISIPPKEQLLNTNCSVPTAAKGEKWVAEHVGIHQKKRGVYIIHQADEILYIGKTGKQSEGKNQMDFATRLRRHFTESGSGANGIYRMLKARAASGQTHVSFLDAEHLPNLIQGFTRTNKNIEDALICVMEAAMIYEFDPTFQSLVGKSRESK